MKAQIYREDFPSYFSVRLCLCIISSLLFSIGSAQELSRYRFSHAQMGTNFQVILYANDHQAAKAAVQEAFATLDKMNARMSDYLPKSELNKLSEASSLGEWVNVSPELLVVLLRSQAMAKRSKGAFDISVGPLVKLWRKARKEKRFPPKDVLRSAKKRTGYKKWKINADGQVKFRKKDMSLDLGGIAKGYVAEQMLGILKGKGFSVALVDAGGDISLGDPPPASLGWKVGIELLNDSGEMEMRSVQLANCAIATSGDLYRYVELDGVRYSHIVNPKTGIALTDRRRVSVIAPNGTDADALASALSVMKPAKGLRLLASFPGSHAVIIRKEANTNQQYISLAFEGIFNQ